MTLSLQRSVNHHRATLTHFCTWSETSSEISPKGQFGTVYNIAEILLIICEYFLVRPVRLSLKASHYDRMSTF